MGESGEKFKRTERQIPICIERIIYLKITIIVATCWEHLFVEILTGLL